MAEDNGLTRFRDTLNGNADLFKLIVEVIVVVLFVWTFCQVRDIPAVYVTKAEAKAIKMELKTDVKDGFIEVKERLSSIENYLRDEK